MFKIYATTKTSLTTIKEIHPTSVSELISIIALDNLHTRYVLEHVDNYGSTIYTDLSNYLTESPIRAATLEALCTQLTDKSNESYRTTDPKGTGEHIRTYLLSELPEITAELVNVNMPDKRAPIVAKQDKYPDLVLYTDQADIELNNLLVSVNGRLHRTLKFEKELYVLDCAKELTNENHTVIDTTPIGGHTTYYMNELSRKVDTENRCVYLTLPDDKVFTHAPWIVLDGSLYIFPIDQMIIINATTLKIELSYLFSLDIVNSIPPAKTDAELIDKYITSSRSSILVPNQVTYAKRCTLSPTSATTYLYQTDTRRLSGICMCSHDNYIVPYDILHTDVYFPGRLTDYVVYANEISHPTSMAETMLSPQHELSLSEPYHKHTRVDIDLITISN